MVGIAGGVWSKKHDVHLGDVVVSQPGGRFGCIVQYDCGRTVKGGRFEHTTILSEPPRKLLQSMQTLKENHALEGDRLPYTLRSMFEKLGSTAPNFAFPGMEHDQLFDASYEHESGDADCDDCDSRRVPQGWRRRERSDPQIHYGTIASANQVMRHGPTRDKVAKDVGAICFEMEAAGLMNSFPCLVIRGICDYADTHKNKNWQGYAAATAAAFMKELLDVVPKQEVVDMRPACKFTRSFSIPGSQVDIYIYQASPNRALWCPSHCTSGLGVPVLMMEFIDENKHWIVPRGSSPRFTGRTGIMEELEQQLCASAKKNEDKQRRFVIIGMGGMGKSELCLKVAENLRERFVIVVPKSHGFPC